MKKIQNVLKSAEGSIAMPYGYFTESIEYLINEFAAQSGKKVFVTGMFSSLMFTVFLLLENIYPFLQVTLLFQVLLKFQLKKHWYIF